MPQSTARLDVSLLDKKLAPTRQRAQALILAGRVLVNQKPITKPGIRISESDRIVIKGTDMPYVSRGGIKLAALNPIRGSAKVARFFAGLVRKQRAQGSTIEFDLTTISL